MNMARFEFKQSNHPLKSAAATVVTIVLVFVLFVAAIGSVSDSTVDRQQESLETALNRAIAYCYAVEGSYPENLDYIKTHFGVTWDESSFYVDYRVQGGNIYPDVTVLHR